MVERKNKLPPENRLAVVRDKEEKKKTQKLKNDPQVLIKSKKSSDRNDRQTSLKLNL